MRYISIFIIFIFISTLQAQDISLEDDYTLFGRKEPLTMGSAFSSLGTSTLMVNPANIAYFTDNRLALGTFASGSGYGYMVSWVAPNFSIGNARQRSISDLDYEYEKTLLQFNFGISTTDLGLTGDRFSIAAGANIKQQSDWIYDTSGEKLKGGNGLAYDIGLLVKWNFLVFELAMIDMNEPELSDSRFYYNGGILMGARYQNNTGLIISLQGVSGDRYQGTDFGLNLGAEQTFFEQRLISRVQLTSYFNGPEAAMQNISCSIGYRFSSKGKLFSPIKDLELNYALSFLALPQNIGTHMLVLVKYF